MTATFLDTALMAVMRDWVSECTWADIQSEGDLDEMSDSLVWECVRRNYAGGVSQFISDAGAL